MADIKTFSFSKDSVEDVKKHSFCLNWPVVYLIEDDKELYVGETANVYYRINQHLKNPERKKLKKIHIITDEEYNKSATLDIESNLIQYMSADGRFVLQNGNRGLRDHNYFDKQRYEAKIEGIWESLRKMKMAISDLVQIKNSDLFKYSPYKSLTIDQRLVAESILHDIISGYKGTHIINGDPGTGKTILATYLFKRLNDEEKTKKLKVGLVVPMTGLRGTLRKIFKNIKGLSSKMVIGPSGVTDKYDVLIVDEAHRLKRRKNITNFKSFDDNNRLLKLSPEATELDWILKCSKNQILFYDENQSVRPSDIPSHRFKELNFKNFKLKSQLRIGNGIDGEKYIKFIQNLFDLVELDNESIDYDFKVYDDLREMIDDIKTKNSKMDLCRIVSGYSWPWISKKDSSKYDIEIGGVKLKWNSVNHNWVYSKNAINEVGCIHTVQGYDLNYTGVIIGPEISYDPKKREFNIHPEKYMDMNGKRGVGDKKELERYIINIYKTLLTRGMKGTYIYIIDEGLREYFKEAVFKKIKQK